MPSGKFAHPTRLHGVRMRGVASADNGVVDAATVFTFEQAGDVFSARYQGGEIVDGYLIGRIDRDGAFRFRYVQGDRTGRIDAGASTGVVHRLPDGRLQMVEDFEWTTRPGGGRNVFEQTV